MDLVTPYRFAPVENGLYRGGYPVNRNFNFLRRLRLRTILSLTPEEATTDLRDFCKAENIQLKHVSAEKHKGEPQLLPNDINECLQVVLNADSYPLYMHCLDGAHVIGLIVMALRKVQMWDYESIQREYQRFTREQKEEIVFIADYGGGFALPPRIPPWLWGGSWVDVNGKAKKHPTLKIKFPHITQHANQGKGQNPASSSSVQPNDRNAAAVRGSGTNNQLSVGLDDRAHLNDANGNQQQFSVREPEYINFDEIADFDDGVYESFEGPESGFRPCKVCGSRMCGGGCAVQESDSKPSQRSDRLPGAAHKRTTSADQIRTVK